MFVVFEKYEFELHEWAFRRSRFFYIDKGGSVFQNKFEITAEDREFLQSLGIKYDENSGGEEDTSAGEEGK